MSENTAAARTVESEHRRAQTLQIEVDALSAALADACDLLEGWVDYKCAARHKPEHMAHIAKLRATIPAPLPSDASRGALPLDTALTSRG